MKNILTSISLLAAMQFSSLQAQEFKLDPAGYFRNEGVDVMAFSDVYPEGKQAGLTLIMNSNRVAASGDIRLETSQGQWQPLPVLRNRQVNEADNSITVTLSYPDSSRHMTGFNPTLYPDFVFQYTVRVTGEGENVVVTVDLDTPVPQKYEGKVGFNLELYPGSLLGKPWIMDSKAGIFPAQANGPTISCESNTQWLGDFNPAGKVDLKHLLGDGTYNPMIADDIVAAPYARGKKFTMNPSDPYNKVTVRSEKGDLILYDGRMNHNNGWFVLRTEIPAGVSKNAIKWVITPHVVKDWLYTPVVQTSQVGYHPDQPKVAVIELDSRDKVNQEPVLYRITDAGEEVVPGGPAQEWGKFLRYNYLRFDFSSVREEGLYQVRYGESASPVFRIAGDIYERGVWQPELEYFLPIQMCHMRVNEKYRVWHDLCHMDDARMAPVDLSHIDGYSSGPSTLTNYQPGDYVPGLTIGGWHDAGDYDLRVESQAGEAYILALAYEHFGIDYDATTIDHHKRITEIHQPDGKPDLLQQVENGALTVVAGYRALGRLYRGIICNSVRQYVHLGDASAHTDNVTGNADDRWVFTEDNPYRELTTAAQLSAISRVLKNFNDTLSTQALDAAKELYQVTRTDERVKGARIHAAVELYLTTGENAYKDYVLAEQDYIVKHINRLGWFIGRFDKAVNDAKFTQAMRQALLTVRDQYEQMKMQTPYGVPEDRGNLSSGSWDVQTLGYYYCFLQDAYPDLFTPDYIFNAIHFILGCHSGSNTLRFRCRSQFSDGRLRGKPGRRLLHSGWSYSGYCPDPS